MYKTDPHFNKRMKLVTEALKQDRSVEEIRVDLRETGIIDRNGKLKKPYDKMYELTDNCLKKTYRYRTNIPSARMNFLSGMGSVLNVGGRNFKHNHSSSEVRADQQAIHSDWSVVGNDLRSSLHELMQEAGNKNSKEKENRKS